MGIEAVIDEHTFDNRFAADSKLYVVFFMQAVKNGGKSELEGRPIFDDVPHGDTEPMLKTCSVRRAFQRDRPESLVLQDGHRTRRSSTVADHFRGPKQSGR